MINPSELMRKRLPKKNKLPLRSYVRVARILIGRGSYQDGFSYLEKIEKIFGQGYSDEDEKEIRLLQAEVMRATGKDADARKILTNTGHPASARRKSSPYSRPTRIEANRNSSKQVSVSNGQPRIRTIKHLPYWNMPGCWYPIRNINRRSNYSRKPKPTSPKREWKNTSARSTTS